MGLGDAAIPGLPVSLLLRHDLAEQVKQHSRGWQRSLRIGWGARRMDGEKRGTPYFLGAVAGYAAGLFFTFVSMHVMQQGQPALLFLVPGTLLPTYLLALWRGEFNRLWTADYAASSEVSEGDFGLQDEMDAYYTALPDKSA